MQLKPYEIAIAAFWLLSTIWVIWNGAVPDPDRVGIPGHVHDYPVTSVAYLLWAMTVQSISIIAALREDMYARPTARLLLAGLILLNFWPAVFMLARFGYLPDVAAWIVCASAALIALAAYVRLSRPADLRPLSRALAVLGISVASMVYLALTASSEQLQYAPYVRFVVLLLLISVAGVVVAANSGLRDSLRAKAPAT